MKTGSSRGSRIAALTIGACLATAVALAPASSADITIGANVNQVTPNKGTCGFEFASERPCVIVTTILPGQSTLSPCNGTITRFRLNGLPKPANHYRLRVVRRNADGSFTGTASSAPVSIATEGVNEYATSLPIAAGEMIGIDFLDSTEEFGLRWAGGTGVHAPILYRFPDDGGSAQPNETATFYYLYNADIACAPVTPPPILPIAAPSNGFKVVSLKATTLTLDLDSAGVVAVSDGSPKVKAHKKAKPKLLKPSSASGGPGTTTVKLKLTGAAKKIFLEKGKLKLPARITFTPTGGTANTIVKVLRMKKARSTGPKGLHART